MRILVVSNLYPPAVVGGYEMRCAGLVAGLRAEHEVVVLTSREGGEQPDDAGAGVLRLLPFLRPTYVDSLRAPLLSVSAARTARDVLARVEPDLVFIFNGASIPQAALRVLETSGVPVAWSVGEGWYGDVYRHDQFLRHLAPGETGLRGVWARAMRALNRWHPALRLELESAVPAAVMWGSDAMRSFIASPPTTRPVLERTIYAGTRNEAIYAAAPRCPDDDPLIAFVGRIEPQKGPDVAVRALDELERRHGIRARLLMCGHVRPEQGAAVERLARELGLASRVTLMGFLEPQQLAERLAHAHVMLLPYVWQEPVGIVCLEGGLARVPIVAARSGGMPELLREEEGEALFFDRGDVRGCAAALASALGDPVASAERAERAYVRARSFAWSSYVQQVGAFLVTATATLSTLA
jgi:glycosyltransferase involved in cell wall biosynthesis